MVIIQQSRPPEERRQRSLNLDEPRLPNRLPGNND
jgi:hypothetical protein